MLQSKMAKQHTTWLLSIKSIWDNATKCSLQFAYIILHHEKDNVDQAIMVIRFVLILKAFWVKIITVY